MPPPPVWPLTVTVPFSAWIPVPVAPPRMEPALAVMVTSKLLALMAMPFAPIAFMSPLLLLTLTAPFPRIAIPAAALAWIVPEFEVMTVVPLPVVYGPDIAEDIATIGYRHGSDTIDGLTARRDVRDSASEIVGYRTRLI
jgi:hypothetical protein